MDLRKHFASRRALQKKGDAEEQGQWPAHFLAQLASVLTDDIALLAKGDEEEALFARVLRVQRGTYEAAKEKGAKSPASPFGRPSRPAQPLDYLYLQIANLPGFLWELSGEGLTVTRATQAKPLLKHYTGEDLRPTIFVALGSPLETFQFIDDHTIRSSSGQTLSVEQCAEMLLSLALESMVNA